MPALASAVATSALGVFAPSAVLAASTAAAELLPPPPPPAWGTDVYWGTGITVNAPVYCPEGGCPPASPPPLTPWGEPQPTPEEAAGRWTFFALLCLCGLVQTVLCPISLYVAWSRISFARLLRLRREEGGEEKYRAARSEQGLDNWSYPPVAVLVPCYLPNERQIIVETIEQIVHNLKYPADVRVCLVYNTPHDMPADEKALVALQNRKWPAGRSVVVYKAQTSRSKAENLNLAIRNLVQEELVAIYDADHWPDAYALMLLVEKLLDTNSDAVQGSVYIRDVEHKSCRQSTIARCAPRVPAAPYRATHHHPVCSPPALARTAAGTSRPSSSANSSSTSRCSSASRPRASSAARTPCGAPRGCATSSSPPKCRRRTSTCLRARSSRTGGSPSARRQGRVSSRPPTS